MYNIDSLFTNKRILFIAPKFFGYADMITQRMRTYGAIVDLFYDLPTDFFSKLRLFREKKNNIIEYYYNEIKKKLSVEYDNILIIKGMLIPDFFYQYLQKKYPNSCFIQYHWDDIELCPNIERTFKYFDKIFTYNLLDCQKYGFQFRPFFYNEELSLGINKTNDLYFIGSYTPFRMEFVNLFFNLPDLRNIKYIKCFYINILTFFTSQLSFRYLPFFIYRKISYNSMMQSLADSKMTLDVPYITQTGLTTRNFEALMTKTKIITTNCNIKHYDIYHPQNIHIVNVKKPYIDLSWFDQPYIDYPYDVIKNYTLKTWLIDIFGD